LPRVFEPFFTTKEIGKGTGLGLSMVYGFAKQSGGHVAIQSEVGRGTEIQLYLPKSKTPTRAMEGGELADAPRGKGECVLVVEDEAPLRKLTKQILNELGYTALSAADGVEALAVLNSTERLDLLLSDVVLPGTLSGANLAQEAIQIRPNLKFLLMSGYAPDAVVSDAQLWNDAELLTKPFRVNELAHAVRSVLDESGPASFAADQ
jgi:CheY-like chemotaxis protein